MFLLCCCVNETLLLETPQVGFEPTTNRLTVDRSATELLRIAYLSTRS